jgi:6-phosphofructokinase 2
VKTIITLTMNPAIDKSSAIENVVDDQKLRCDPPEFEPGGGGINVARAIHRLGGTAIAWYMSGGRTGNMLSLLLAQEKVEHRAILVEHETRENLMIVEKSTGRQYRFGMPGPELNESEWKRALELLSQANPKPDYIVASGSLPRNVPTDFFGRVVRIGKSLNAMVAVDTSGEALCEALEEGLHLIKPNMREFETIARCEFQGEHHHEKIAAQLVEERKTDIIVISLGAGGVLAAWPGGMKKLRSPTVPIKSRVGAGDSMLAGIVLSLAQDRPIMDSIQYGIAAGAAAVMTSGSELCRKEDTEILYEKIRKNT